MSREEVRASVSLASIFALRMLGMFLILPVFAVHARSLPGGDSATLVGLAMGIYGLTQSFGQIPFGAASDKYGRKRVIIIGLILFALGSFVAAAATNIYWVIFGRAAQGAGAISAAVTAYIADTTREEHRTKAMAMVGGSIGLTFALSLIAAPVLYQAIGMGGIFILTGVLSIAAIFVVAYVVPPAPLAPAMNKVPFSSVLKNGELLRLNYGVFALHLTQMAMFVVVPAALVQFADLPIAEHWKVYLPVVLGSFILMLPAVFAGERRGRSKQVFLGAIMLMCLVQAGFWLVLSHPDGMHWGLLVALLLAFFIAFNILEATQPSLVSRLAPASAKGAALGVYNTLQAIGLFCGGAMGGWMKQHLGPQSVFILGMAVSIAWLIIASGMRNLPPRGVAQPAAV
ncbi:Predicted arabinose efflux permease, MFS family [Noviherbaspirillum humi]|uniref:Predicted arabinose efflux permease, MFS family n=1 Tax=Noviherbaspirillum humi TaxID=1688639 RepID=A0A239JEL9_9BURK|nr:MFS transporter [Noviherbaspirillum humi]SNT04247.1 Predicted arabinose efflux permease, MFS family [Noviherbaspirillum humi]